MFQPIRFASGASDNAPVAADKMNDNFSELYALLAQFNDVEVFTVGDSLSDQNGNMNDRSALAWALALHWPNVLFDPTTGNLGVGTSVSGAARSDGNAYYGMTSAARLARDAAAFRASIAKGRLPLALMSIGTNDSGLPSDNGQGGTESTAANVRKWWAYMEAQGIPVLLRYMTPGPGGGASATPIKTRGVALALQALADQTRGRFKVIDNSTILARDTAEYRALGTTGAVGGVMRDELHPGGYGEQLMGQYTLGPSLVADFGRRPSRLGFRGDAFNSQTNVRGSIMGGLTRYGGTGSSAGDHNVTGGGGLVSPAGFPTGRSIEANLSGNQTIACAAVPDPFWSAMGRPDIMASRLRFAGTPTASGVMTITATANLPSGYDPSVTPFFGEAMLYVDITNIKMPSMGWTGGGFGGQSGSDADVIPRLVGQLRLGNTVPTTCPNYNNMSATLTTSWVAGQEVAGDIIICAAGIYPYAPAPAATA